MGRPTYRSCGATWWNGTEEHLNEHMGMVSAKDLDFETCEVCGKTPKEHAYLPQAISKKKIICKWDFIELVHCNEDDKYYHKIMTGEKYLRRIGNGR